MAFQNFQEGDQWLPRYLLIYTGSGSTQPSAAGQRAALLFHVERHNT
jgi:hypothetical protein